MIKIVGTLKTLTGRYIFVETDEYIEMFSDSLLGARMHFLRDDYTYKFRLCLGAPRIKEGDVISFNQLFHLVNPIDIPWQWA